MEAGLAAVGVDLVAARRRPARDARMQNPQLSLAISTM